MRFIKCDSDRDLAEKVGEVLATTHYGECSDPEEAASAVSEVAADCPFTPGILIVDCEYGSFPKWSCVDTVVGAMGATTLRGFRAYTVTELGTWRVIYLLGPCDPSEEDLWDSRPRVPQTIFEPSAQDAEEAEEDEWDSMIDALADATDTDEILRQVLDVELECEVDKQKQEEQIRSLKAQLAQEKEGAAKLKAQLAQAKEDADTLMHAHLGLLRKHEAITQSQ